MWQKHHIAKLLLLVVATVLMMTPARASFTAYPAFGDNAPAPSQVEAIVDKGLILHIIVRCRTGSAIVTYSKAERLYCTPRHACGGELGRTLAATCEKDIRPN